MDGWVDGWGMNVCMHACIHAWIDGWMDGWMDEWMDGWIICTRITCSVSRVSQTLFFRNGASSEDIMKVSEVKQSSLSAVNIFSLNTIAQAGFN